MQYGSKNVNQQREKVILALWYKTKTEIGFTSIGDHVMKMLQSGI